jgi:glutathione S-transferase
MPVRWALEEVGQPYVVERLSFAALKEPAHRARHPFGQIPTFQDGELVLFESGAIVLHIAGRRPGLLPDDANARARATASMFAALNTVEPPIWEFAMVALLEAGMPWFAARQTMLRERVTLRLADLSSSLGDGDWLDDAFSAGDLLMVTVLRRLRGSGLLDVHPNLADYVARGEARPAFQRAFAAQLALFETAPEGR